MARQALLIGLLLSVGFSGSYSFARLTQTHRLATEIGGQPLNRKSFGVQLLTAVPIIALLPEIAKADVSDGTMLPQGAQQFQKALRLRTDISVSTTSVLMPAETLQCTLTKRPPVEHLIRKCESVWLTVLVRLTRQNGITLESSFATPTRQPTT